MARPKIKTRPVVGKIGNYAAPVDTAGMDPDMIAMMIGTKPTKVESSYMRGGGSSEAVRRARRANKQPPLKGS